MGVYAIVALIIGIIITALEKIKPIDDWIKSHKWARFIPVVFLLASGGFQLKDMNDKEKSERTSREKYYKDYVQAVENFSLRTNDSLAKYGFRIINGVVVLDSTTKSLVNVINSTDRLTVPDLEITSSGHTYKNDSTKVLIDLTLTNTGNSPADSVKVNYQAIAATNAGYKFIGHSGNFLPQRNVNIGIGSNKSNTIIYDVSMLKEYDIDTIFMVFKGSYQSAFKRKYTIDNVYNYVFSNSSFGEYHYEDDPLLSAFLKKYNLIK